MDKIIAFFKGALAWAKAHLVASIAIGVGAVAVLTTSIVVPVAVSNAGHTVIWCNEDGTVLEKDEKVKKDEIPTYDGATPTKAANAQYTYTFAGWDKEIAASKEDITYTATFSSTVNKYGVKFLDEDGTELKSESLDYGTTPEAPANPEKADTDECDYSFAGWDKQIETVQAEQTYTATYSATKQKYTVTWNNYDGAELEKDTDVEFGTTPEYNGTTPTRAADAQYTYTFKTWDKEISAVTGDVTYTATFDSVVNKYTVTWKNWDGNPLKIESLDYGETPVAPANPEKADTAEWDYTFTGWDHEIEAVHGNQTYIATYSQQKQTYSIKWYDGNGDLLKTDTLEYGDTPEYSGDTPTQTSTVSTDYTFADSWEEEIVSVTGDASYHAHFNTSARQYNVIFKDFDDDVIHQQKSPYGQAPEYTGDIPTREDDIDGYSYIFCGWDRDFEILNEHGAEYKAAYLKVKLVSDHYEVFGLDGSMSGHLDIPAEINSKKVKAIRNDAFNSTNISGVTIPNNVISIGSNAFNNTKIKSLELPASVESIGDYGFANNEKLESVTLNAGLETIGQYAFQRAAIEEIDIPASVGKLGYGAFGECWHLLVVGLHRTDFSKYDKYAFSNSGSITEVLLYAGGSIYGKDLYDFAYVSLTGESIENARGEFTKDEPDEENGILGNVYYQPHGTSNIYLVSAYGNGTKLHTRTATHTKQKALLGNRGITEITIGSSMLTINDGTFHAETSCETVIFEEGSQLNIYGYSAFRNMGITSIDMSPRSISYISYYAFAENSKLESITFSADTKSFYSYCFLGCAFKELYLPAGITSIDNSAFRSCNKLEKVEVDKDNETYKSVDDCLCSKDGHTLHLFPSAKECTGNTFTIPEDVTTLRGNVFQNLKTVRTVNLPSTLETLGEFCFLNCPVTTLNYPGTKDEFEALSLYGTKPGQATSWASGCAFKVVNCLGDSSTSNLGMAS